jgi:hypothetical protein
MMYVLNQAIEKCQFLTLNVKNYPNLSNFFFIEEYHFRGMFYCFWHFLKTFLRSTLFLKLRPFFVSLI